MRVSSYISIPLIIGSWLYPVASWSAEQDFLSPENTDTHLPVNLIHRDPVNFVPFTIDEIKNPETGSSLQPWEFVTVESADGPSIYVGNEYLDHLNMWEQKLNSIGQSFRSDAPELMINAFSNPDIWGRELRRDLHMNLQSMGEQILPEIKDCPLLKIEDLGQHIDTGLKYKLDDVIKFENELSVKIEDLLPRLNEQQKFLCRLGYSMLAGVLPGQNDLLIRVLETRKKLMEILGIDRNHPVFGLAAWAKDFNYVELKNAMAEVKDAINKPTPEKIYVLSQKYKHILPPELRLPAIPAIPSQRMEKRVDLKLKKRYEWKGVDEGSKDVAAMYANAWAELRAGRIEEPDHAPTSNHAFQAEAKAGVWLINNEISIIQAIVDSALDPNNAYAKLKYCVLGVCDTQESGIKDFSIEVSDPNAFNKNIRTDYSQQLIIGVVPVVLKVGAAASTRVGWKAGLNVLGVYGGAEANAKASALGEAAVGVQDFIEAGAGGELMIVDDTLNLDGNAQIKFHGNGHPVIEANITGDNQLSALSGRIYMYALIDALGPLGELVDAIIESIKKIPGATELMKKAGKLTDLGKKVYNKLSDGGKAIENGVRNAGGNVSNYVKKRCCKFSGRAPVLAGTPYGTTINGTKIRYERDWLNWQGSHHQTRFLNYKLFIGPDGKEYGGDMNTASSDETALFEANLSLQQREIEIARLEHESAAAEHKTFNESVQSFLQQEQAAQTIAAIEDWAETNTKLAEKHKTLIEQVIASLSGDKS